MPGRFLNVSAFQLFLQTVHFVFLNQYYPPDAAPTGVMLEGLVEELVRDGHEVTVLCASGGYAGGEQGAESGERGAKSRNAEARAPCSTLQAPCCSPRIIQIGATSFGRGTFIGKLLDYASYYVGVAWMLLVLRPKPDRIVALTTPPLLSVLARLFSKIRGADHAHWVMDLYPDVMAAHGMLGEKSTIYRILAGLARWGFGGRRRAAVLTLGPDMAERVGRVMGKTLKTDKRGEARRGAKETVICWVPLWATGGDDKEKLNTEIGEDADLASTPSICPSAINTQHSTSSMALRHKRGWGDGELIVMYSGNMGLGHRFGEILEAAGRVNIEHQSADVTDSVDTSPRGRNESRHESRGLEMPADSSNYQPSTPNSQPSPIRFVFFGGGKRRAEVEAFARENPNCAVEVHDYAPAEELAVHLQSADVHLASLDAAWTGTMVPSKLQGIFAAGRPVIFIGSADSSIGRWVNESGGGWVVPAGDAAGLLAALGEARDPEIRLQRGQSARTFAETHFKKRTNVARVAAILTQSC